MILIAYINCSSTISSLIATEERSCCRNRVLAQILAFLRPILVISIFGHWWLISIFSFYSKLYILIYTFPYDYISTSGDGETRHSVFVFGPEICFTAFLYYYFFYMKINVFI